MEKWQTIELISYLGKERDSKAAEWDQKYGTENWRLIHQASNGETLTYADIFWKVYVAGYSNFFLHNLNEAQWISSNFSYTYDKDLISFKSAFDPYALYQVPNTPNQFHHTALNIALVYFTGFPFKGENPLQVREGKPGTPISTWPAGWRFSPGKIKAVRADLIPQTDNLGWWQKGSIEDFYQSSKILQVRS